MDRRGHLHLRDARAHELEERHLRRRVLHGDAVRPQQEVRLASRELLRSGLVEVAEDDLFRERERTAKTRPHLLDALLHLPVRVLDKSRGRLDGRQALGILPG